MMVAFAPVRRVSSTAQVVALGKSEGRVRGFTRGDQEEAFLYASQHPPPGCVRCVGRRASVRTFDADGSLDGW